MNFQQLRYVVELSRQRLSVSATAASLHTSQPGVSKQIRLLEEALGVEIFIRHGKRLTAITAPGREVIKVAERMLREVDNLQAVGQAYLAEDVGSLTIATTHTQARYALPRVIADFMRRYPKVKLHLHQGTPTQNCEMVLRGEADIAIATEAIADTPDLVMLPCRQWNRSVVALPDHPILRTQPLTLEAIAAFPIITYDSAFTGRGAINRAFLGRALKPEIVLTALDSDVIKAYVATGLGIGIIASMAYDPLQDRQLRALDASHLFESSTTRIGLPRNAWLRSYSYAFIESFAPQLTRTVIDSALAGGGSDPGL